MNRTIPLTLGTAAGGLLTAAFLASGTAWADGAGSAVFPDVPGPDAFTIGQTTFDPYVVNADGTAVEGYAAVNPLFSIAPFGEIGGGDVSLLGSQLPNATQAFDIYTTGTDPSLIGAVNTNEDVADILGISNTEFTISDVATAAGVSASAVPADGTVYDVLNLGDGFANVYTDVPGATAGTVTDTFVTPFGNVDLSALFAGFDATQALDPGNAFAGLTDAASALAGLFSL